MEAADGWKHPGQEPTVQLRRPMASSCHRSGDETKAPEANYPLLAASVLVMSVVVVLFNRIVWRRLYALAEKRFSITR